MIEALTIHAPAERRAPAKDPADEAGFSLALAAASLERQAGAALKAHGGAPEASAAIGEGAARRQMSSPATNHAEAAPDPAQGQSAQDRPPAEKSSLSAEAPPPPPAHPRESRGPGASQNWVPAFAGMSGGGAGGASAPAPAVQPRTSEAAAPRDLAPVKLASLQKPRAAARPAAPTEDFVKLLARRLDAGATAFDIRLDPPALGRVEARLTLADNGKATLSLTFDNQAAFDLFARDDAALRAALSDAGFNLGGDVAFSLERDAPARPEAPAADPVVIPLRAAAIPRGVVDLFV